MRIAHVVTYVSKDGAFGGPVAVALAQTEELARRGHQVDLLAGWDGEAVLPSSDVTHRLFPVKRVAPGFCGLVSPAMLRWMRAHGRDYDTVHVHLGRDLITLSAARTALSMGRRVVVQTHGMVLPDRRPKARVLDALATRSVLSSAATVFTLTDQDKSHLSTVLGRTLPTVEMIPNGIPAQRKASAVERDGRPVVMFLARLHPRKRVLAFAEAAHLMIGRGSDAVFEIFGPDEGDLDMLRSYIDAHGLGERILYRGTVAQGAALDELRRATVYVLPAVKEVFPMTVLESLSVGTPVVLGEDCGIAPELSRRGAASVSTGTPEDLADHIGRLVEDPAFRRQMQDRGSETVASWFSIEAVTHRLESAYSATV